MKTFTKRIIAIVKRQSSTDSHGNKTSLTCPTHSDKVIEFYCQTHSSILCGVCVVLDHRRCEVDYIPGISVGYKESTDYRQFKDDLEQLIANASLYSLTAESPIKQTERSAQAIIDEVQTFMNDFHYVLKEKEQDIISDVGK